MTKWMLILGNLFGGLSSIFLGLSVHKKTKKDMVGFQILDCTFAIISCLFLKGYNGAVSNGVALTRNAVEYKGKSTRIFTGTLVVITLMLGIFNFTYNEKTWYSLLPIIASVEYTVGLTRCKSYTRCKVSLLVNLILWMIYSICTLNIVMACVDFVLCINTIYTIKMANQQFSDNGLTKFQRAKLKFEHSRVSK